MKPEQLGIGIALEERHTSIGLRHAADPKWPRRHRTQRLDHNGRQINRPRLGVFGLRQVERWVPRY